MALPLDQLFRIASTVVLVGWVALAFAPYRRGAAVVVARLVAAVLCGGYAVLVAWSIARGPGLPSGASFMTLNGISSLFSSRQALLAGWVHYLAFDLWAGAWEVEDAARARVPHWLLLVCLVLTFLAGPVGLLLYLLVKVARRR
jgi:hypothetical protein